MFYLSGTRMTCEICAFDKCTNIFGEVHEKDALWAPSDSSFIKLNELAATLQSSASLQFTAGDGEIKRLLYADDLVWALRQKSVLSGVSLFISKYRLHTSHSDPQQAHSEAATTVGLSGGGVSQAT